jgi:O-antigen/teichoic acid export membrane protein
VTGVRDRVATLIEKARHGDLVSESAWSLGLELATMVGMFVSFALLGSHLGPERFAPYVALYAIVAPLVTLAASGVGLALLQHVVRDKEPLDESVRSCLSLTVLLGGGLTVVGGLLAFVIVDGMSGVAIVSLLVTEFVTTPLVMVVAFTVQAATSYTESAKIRIVFVVARMGLVVVLFVAGSLNFTSLGVFSLASTTVFAAVLLHRASRRFGFAFIPGPIRLHHLRTNVVYSVGISAASLNNDGDKIVLAANNLTVDTGLYGAAYKVVNLGLVPVSSIVASSHRRFLEHAEGVKGQHLRRAIKFAVVTGGYGAVIAVVMMLAAPLLPWLLGEEWEGSVTMIRWLSPLVLLRSVAMFPINALMGLRKTFARSVIIVVNAVVALLAYVVLIPAHGWKGGVYGTMVSEVLLLGSTWTALVVYQRRADRDDAGPASSEIDAPAIDLLDPASPTEPYEPSASP